jgi:hypothetical protein
MSRSKFSTKALMLAGALGLSVATLGAAPPAVAQDFACPIGTVYDPPYGCSAAGYVDPFYTYFPGYGYRYGHHDFGHMGGFHGGGFHGGMAGGFHGGGGHR